jgi:hypothetical protein
MVINQRGTVNTPVTPANTQYTLDRFNTNLTQSSKYSIQQSTTAPTGFGFSLLATSVSAFSVGASDFFDVFQPIEGFNFSDVAFGTASAKTITISLWINASIAGTYGGYLINASGNRTCVFSYSVPVANTWTYVTATVPGDTSGSWVGATNGVGIYVVPVSLGAGSSVTTSTTNTWGSAGFRGFTGQVNMVGTNGATVYITGVQLEVGVTATSFDFRSYTTELQLCQRYFWRIQGETSTLGYASIGTGSSVGTDTSFLITKTPVRLRTNPTLSFNGTISQYPSGTAVSAIINTYSSSSFDTIFAQLSGGGFSSAGQGVSFYTANNTNNWFAVSAEL